MSSSEYRKRRSKSKAGERFPRIAIESDIARFGRKTVEALARLNGDSPWLFRTQDGLARVETDLNGALTIRALTADRMHHELAEGLVFFCFTEEGEVEAPPSSELARFILAMPDPPFPRLKRIVSTPIFGPTGELVASQGYHAASELYLDLSRDLKRVEVTPKPDREELKLYRQAIDGILCDFPFTGPAEIAHAFSALLLPFVRAMIAGPTPIHVVEKPTPGTGATLLIQAFGDIVGAQPMLLDECRSNDEWSRRLLAALHQAPFAILIDNVTASLDSPALAAAVTADRFCGRKVGTSEIGAAPVESEWFVTGNNPKLSVELLRRSVRIRLDTGLERPDRGRKFRHPRLRTWIREHRPLLVEACLTLIRAWVAAGMPKGKQILGGFEEWSEVLGGILDVNGIPGFLGNLDEHRESADSEAPIRAFLARWYARHENHWVAAKQVFDLADDLDLGDGDERSRRIRLGKLLERHQGRCFGELRLERGEGSTGGSGQWRLRKTHGEA